MKQLGWAVLLSIGCCFVYHILRTLFIDNSWYYNRSYTFKGFLFNSWWVLKSVLFEELIFRGALLFIAIRKLGVQKACLLSAVAFGIYHWFSYNAFSNPDQMAIIFLMTGIFGYVIALAFAKTGSLYLPIGLHLGWNLANIILFSNGPLGHQILVRVNDLQLQGLPSLAVFLFQTLALPALSMVYLRFFVKKTKDIRVRK
ncbi:CPBP family intramembrane glutamic endopeptidase [Niabella yanshanensis]|uniref:CPBP family intramembrane glutamic endopeptidase n=1 Tax=Niabella yanshanensis TaxID=577386 RepID=A0ABZ0W6C2_9BACT|nr:CPBP family intramembrane glutamic endopeptidase [Niabella yanshanensis]WQD38828.1 CPBP family intramembrane glutamic endopeptidase [Niabella yanshanensis]